MDQKPHPDRPGPGLFRWAAAAAAGAALLGLTGCGSMEDDPDSSTLPWTQPAEWENNAPGFGGPGGFPGGGY